MNVGWSLALPETSDGFDPIRRALRSDNHWINPAGARGNCKRNTRISVDGLDAIGVRAEVLNLPGLGPSPKFGE